MTSIYALIDPITEECRYIGKTAKPSQRYSEHCSDRKRNHKGNWIKSLLPKKPIMVVLEVVDGDGCEDEQWWIMLMRSFGFRLVNSTKGGEGTLGYSLPESAKIKIGEANRRRQVSEETRRKLSEASRSRKVSDETKRKIGDAHRGKIVSDETRRKLIGRVVSDETRIKLSRRAISKETREKMSASAKGKKMSDEARKNMSLVRTGRKHSPHTIEKMKQARINYWNKKKENTPC